MGDDIGNMNPVTANFTKVDAGEEMTFENYAVNCDEEDPDAVKGWGANSDTFNTYTPEGLFQASFIYCPQWMADALSAPEEEGGFGYPVTKGWYNSNDEGFTTNCKDTKVDFGNGVVAKSTMAGAKITFSGAVKPGPTMIDIGQFTIAGNVSAKTINLGDIVVNCDEEDPDAVKGWGANSDTINVYTAEGLYDKGFIYCPQWMADALSAPEEEGGFGYPVPKGWYANTDETFEDCYNTKRQFIGGEGFVAKSTMAGAVMTIKSALATEDK